MYVHNSSFRTKTPQLVMFVSTVKPVLSGHSKTTPKIGFQYRLSLNAGQKYGRMLRGEHSAIHSTFIKLPFPIKTFVMSVFKWPLKTGFTNHRQPRGTARKSGSTITRHQEDKLSKATNSLFPIKMIAILEWT